MGHIGQKISSNPWSNGKNKIRPIIVFSPDSRPWIPEIGHFGGKKTEEKLNSLYANKVSEPGKRWLIPRLSWWVPLSDQRDPS